MGILIVLSVPRFLILIPITNLSCMLQDNTTRPDRLKRPCFDPKHVLYLSIDLSHQLILHKTYPGPLRITTNREFYPGLDLNLTCYFLNSTTSVTTRQTNAINFLSSHELVLPSYECRSPTEVRVAQDLLIVYCRTEYEWLVILNSIGIEVWSAAI